MIRRSVQRLAGRIMRQTDKKMRRMDGARKGQTTAGPSGDETQRFAYRAAMRSLRFAMLLLLLLPLLAAGCGRAADSEQLRLCRLLPAVLHPDGTEIRERRVAPAPLARSGLRVDYTARERGAASHAHFLVCGFAGTTFERDRLDLVAAETDEGPLGEARLLYLKRFLAEAEREGGQALPSQNLPQFPAAAAYALLATAYSLIYGLVGRINLAFGEIAVLGAYGAIGGVAAAVALGVGDAIAGLALAFVLAAAMASASASPAIGSAMPSATVAATPPIAP